MSTVYNIMNWERGTNPPISIEILNEQTEAPMSLVGCIIVLAIKSVKWSDSDNDEDALIKKRVACWSVLSDSDLPSLTEARIGDLSWVDDVQNVKMFDGTSWVPVNEDENDILNGQLTFRFDRRELLLPVATYYYSIDIQFPSGEVAKILKGKFKITDNTINEI